MSKIIEYFYIFSKLTTSLVLFLIIIVMGYALFRSYQGIDDVSADLEYKLSVLSDATVLNNTNLLNINKKLNDSDEAIEEIKNILSKKSNSLDNNNYKDDIENLLNLHQQLQEKINLMTKNFQIIENEMNPKSELVQTDQIKSFIDLIFKKYKNGENVKNEIFLLERLIPTNKNEIFEKLYVLESKKFYGLKNLNKEFELSTKDFVKTTFVENNENSIFNFLLNFINVKPSNISIYENQELNILMQAKGYMETEEINLSLTQVLKINKNKKFFNKWIEQAKIYIEFKSEIEKVI